MRGMSKTSDAARECLSLSSVWHLAARDDIRSKNRSLGTNVYSLLARADGRLKCNLLGLKSYVRASADLTNKYIRIGEADRANRKWNVFVLSCLLTLP